MRTSGCESGCSYPQGPHLDSLSETDLACVIALTNSTVGTLFDNKPNYSLAPIMGQDWTKEHIRAVFGPAEYHNTPIAQVLTRMTSPITCAKAGGVTMFRTYTSHCAPPLPADVSHRDVFFCIMRPYDGGVSQPPLDGDFQLPLPQIVGLYSGFASVHFLACLQEYRLLFVVCWKRGVNDAITRLLKTLNTDISGASEKNRMDQKLVLQQFLRDGVILHVPLKKDRAALARLSID